MNLRVNVFIILVLTSPKDSKMLVNGKLIPSDYPFYILYRLFYMCTCKALTVSVKRTIARAIVSWKFNKVQGSWFIIHQRPSASMFRPHPLRMRTQWPLPSLSQKYAQKKNSPDPVAHEATDQLLTPTMCQQLAKCYIKLTFFTCRPGNNHQFL